MAWEHKKLMNDDKGVNTGEMGTTLRYTAKSKLADEVLFPLTDYLFSIDYRGYIDVAVIIPEDGGKPKPMEFTARFGWPHSQIASVLHQGDPAQWMRDLLDGYDSLDVSDEISTGVVCALPDFPYNKVNPGEIAGIPVYCDVMNPHIHPCEIKGGVAPFQVGNKIVDLPCCLTTGTYLLVSTGTAATVSGSARKAYKTLEGIEIPNSPMYRTDIGRRLREELPILQKRGYAQGMTY
jgi:phosphoribosylamine--glycine ligase